MTATAAKSIRPQVRVVRREDPTNPDSPERVLVEYIQMPGETPEGQVRWIIPIEILDGDSIALTPWPPDRHTVVLCEGGGRIRHMFSYDPRYSIHDNVLRNILRSWCWRGWPAQAEQPAASEQAEAELVKEKLLKAIQKEDDPVILWWALQAMEEAVATVRKAREYGSTELEYAGHVIARIGQREVSKPQALELQIFHYVLGKMGRWVAAVTRGEQVSDDTLFDMGVYVRMVQHIRATGEWVE